MRYVVFNDREHPVGHYELEKFPGSNQIVVSTHAFIEEEERGNGYGKEAARERIQSAELLGYDYMLCTVVSTNGAQRHILEDLGWRCLDEFSNRVTGNNVGLYGRRVS